MKNQVIISLLGLAALCSSANAAIPSWKALKTERVESDKTVVWEQVSPGNAGFTNLVRCHPTIAGKVMVCPDMWSAYQSDNYGDKWYALTDYDGDASFFHIRDLSYSVSDPNLAIAICSSELWVTRNLGKNWDVVTFCPWYKEDAEGRDTAAWLKKVAAVAIDPNDENVWFVAGGMNVRAQEWQSSNLQATLQHPRGNTALNEGKVWRTTNGGKSWIEASEGLHPKAQVVRIIVNPKNSKQVFAASNYGIYRSDNGGKSWKMISEGKLDNNIAMDMDKYYNPQTGRFILYAIDMVHYLPDGDTTRCTGGIFQSDDLGETWTKINGNLGLDLNRLTGGVPLNYYKYITRWFKQGEVKKIAKYSTKKEIDAVKAKFPKLPTAAIQPFRMLNADPSCEGRIYIGFPDPQIQSSIMPGRIWVTHNGGKSWTNTARLYEDTWGADKEYWEERGNPWHENMSVGHQSPHMRNGKDYPLRSIRGIDVGVDGTVIINSDHSTMRSVDHGETWQQVDETYTPAGGIVGHGNSNMCIVSTIQDRRTEQTLIASSEHHVWIVEPERYQGSIAIRQRNTAPETVRYFAYDPYDKNTVYLTSGRQSDKQYIFKSTDIGETWEKHGVATPATNKWMDDFYTNSLLIDPINSEYIYHGITTIENKDRHTEGGFYRSSDGGKTFQRASNGLPEIARVKSIVFDPRDKSYNSMFISAEVYNSTWRAPKTTSGGLFYTTDRGETWESLEMPKGADGVQYIKFDNTDRMYITTGHIGGSGDGAWYSDDFGAKWTQFFKEPNAVCIDVSPFDNNLIAVSVCGKAKNPGFYISRDRGETWSKSNMNIVIPHQITSINFDLHKPGKIWLGAYGAGAYRGTIENGDQIQVVEALPNAVEMRDKSSVTLTATIVNPEFKGEKIVWNSENPNIAKVDKRGVVTPVGRGMVKIWASTADKRYTDYSVVTVY